MLNGAGYVAITAGVIPLLWGRTPERKTKDDEEMEMPQDGGDDWEYKILRSHFGSFAKPEILKQVLEEEKLSGWDLLEKFDDSRLRLRRRKNTSLQGSLDPYRTYVDNQRLKRMLLWLLIGVVALMLGFVALVSFLILG